MPKSKGGKPSVDILDLLHAAAEENRAAMDVERVLQDTQMGDTKPLTQEDLTKKRTKVTKRIDAETAELIDQYSTRKVEDPLTDTQKLRLKLAEQNGNSELLGYLSEEKTSGNSKHIEKLYDMINDARTRTFTDAEKQPPAGFNTSRFTDEAAAPEEEVYTQEQMFPMADTLRFDTPVDESEVASYDSDYEKLTEKVTNQDIEFESDGETEGQVKFVDEDNKLLVNGEALDETDLNLRLAFEMMDDEDGTLAKIAEKNREKRMQAQEEKQTEATTLKYTSPDQSAQVIRHYRARETKALRRIFVVALLALGVLFLELASADSSFHPEFLKQGRLGAVYILADLQLLFFITLVMLPAVRNGVKGLVSFKLNTDSLLAVSIFFAAAYSIVLLFTNPTSETLRMCNLPAAFASLCSAVASFMCAHKDMNCLRYVAAANPKYTACELRGGTKEADEFNKYLFEDSDLYTVKRAHFIDGFIERTEKRPKFEDVFNFIIPLVILAGATVFIVISALGKGIVEAYSTFSVIVAASVPTTAFFMITLPVVSANIIGNKHRTAFIGNAIAEEYSTASVLSFADTEVFPSSQVKINNIKLYGDYPLDTILTNLAQVFEYVGGPLSKVLSATLPDKVEKPTVIRVIESANDGLCVAMDGHNYFLGKHSYMYRYRFENPVDEGDKAYEKGVGSIMYVVVDERLVAKLYIKYTVNRRFDDILRNMYRAGLCLGVKTLDPNINNDLINSAIKFRKCPISVLRGTDPDDVMGEVERVDSGVVCCSSLHNFLKMFSLCDKARHITKCNVIISIISVILSFAAVAFLAVTGDVSELSSLYAVAFQLFWLAPVWLISFLMMRK